MKRKSRLLAIAIPVMILLLSGVIYEYGILNIYDEVAAMREMQMFKIRTLQKYTDAIAQKANLEKKIIALRESRKNEDTKIITAQTPAIAAANLQNTIKGIIVSRGATINSDRVEKPEELGMFKVINIVTDVLFPDIKTLTDTLYAIETQIPYLVVKELDVRVRNYTAPKELIVKLKVAAITGDNK